MPKTATRLDKVPPYLFAELDRKRDEARRRGVDVISFGIGDPDQPTAPAVVEALIRHAPDPEHHRYPPYEGLASFRDAMARYYATRFGVSLDPDGEVLAAIGSKEAIAHLIWAYIEPGDVALVPDPAYPVYATQTRLAGGEAYPLPLRPERGYLPDLDAVPDDVRGRAKLLFLNYPNNPTGATAPLAFFEEAVRFAKAHDILVVSDAAYVEMSFTGPQPSLLEVPGAKETAVEFYSLSKPFNMTGWRLGAAVGQREAISALGVVKNNTDTGQFGAIQKAAETALDHQPQAFFRTMNSLYERRMDLLVEGLDRAGWHVRRPDATFYLWAPVPGGKDDVVFSGELLERAGVLVAPGSGYGTYGRGYVRFSLTLDERRLQEGVRRIQKAGPALFG